MRYSYMLIILFIIIQIISCTSTNTNTNTNTNTMTPDKKETISEGNNDIVGITCIMIITYIFCLL